MNQEELKPRTKPFGIRTIWLIDSLPKTKIANVISNQMLRSATSVGANYRVPCRGRPKTEFVAKVGISIEEADEILYQLEVLEEVELVKKERFADLMQEAYEIVAILTATVTTSRKNMRS